MSKREKKTSVARKRKPFRHVPMRNFSQTFKCFVKSVFFDFEMNSGAVYCMEGECVDMAGCICYFERMHPTVESIRSFSGPRLDTAYYKKNGKWTAIDRSAFE